MLLGVLVLQGAMTPSQTPRGLPNPTVSGWGPGGVSAGAGLRFQGAQLTSPLPVVAWDSCHILSTEPGMCSSPRHGAGQDSDP